MCASESAGGVGARGGVQAQILSQRVWGGTWNSAFLPLAWVVPRSEFLESPSQSLPSLESQSVVSPGASKGRETQSGQGLAPGHTAGSELNFHCRGLWLNPVSPARQAWDREVDPKGGSHPQCPLWCMKVRSGPRGGEGPLEVACPSSARPAVLQRARPVSEASET